MFTSLPRLLRDEFFPDGVRSLLSFVQFAIWLVSALGLFLGLLEIPEKLKVAADGRFHIYLWVTFASSTVFVALSALLLQRLLSARRRLERQAADARTSRQRDKELFERAAKLQHHMTEAVRRAVAAGPGYAMRTDLEHVLGSQLREYLRGRIRRTQEFHVTVKGIAGTEAGGYTLTDKFRDAEQDRTSRPRGESEALEGNYVYDRFKNATIEDSRQIYVRDTEASPNRHLRGRAHLRGYRSVLAFPLNMPTPSGAAADQAPGLDRLIGFLGLDSPEPCAFDELFDHEEPDTLAAPRRGEPRAEPPAQPRTELHLFYGLADAAATILMLAQTRDLERDSEESRDAGSHR